MLHYKAVALTRRQRIADLVMIVFGLVAAAYTTTQTIKVSFRVLFVPSNNA